MWDFTILGVDLYHIIQWFIIYSFLGWVWETSYVSIKNHKFVNRGFINGPFCTIYGFGAIGVYLILRPLDGFWIPLFFGGIFVATVLEYLTAVLMESIFHTSWWDYSDNKFNFQGRICLGASIGWGFFTLLLFWVLQPFVEWIVSLYTVAAGKIATYVLGVYYAADFITSALAAFKLSKKYVELEQAVEERRQEIVQQLQKYAARDRGQLIEGAGESLERLRDNLTDTIAERLEGLEGSQLAKAVEELKESQLAKAVEELKSQWASKENFVTRRYLKAYPHLNRGYHRRHHKRKLGKKERG